MTSPQTPENQSASPAPGYTATFHLPDGSRLIVAVAGAVAFSCGGHRGPTRLVIVGPDRRVRARGDLEALLFSAIGNGPTSARQNGPTPGYLIPQGD